MLLLVVIYLVVFFVAMILAVKYAPEGEETENGFRYKKK
jgi:heme/copper-type cytochrome/quinol oxidase subunit 2